MLKICGYILHFLHSTILLRVVSVLKSLKKVSSTLCTLASELRSFLFGLPYFQHFYLTEQEIIIYKIHLERRQIIFLNP
jgi:hypothetical protein